MPQKRNPDPAELIRGKTGRVFGNLQALLSMEKGLPYAYNRDLQEDKALFFEIEEAVNGALGSFSVLVKSLVPNRDRMRTALDNGYLEATDGAEYLVTLGVPFRTAYQASKLLVQRCMEQDKSLRVLNQEDLLVHEAFRKANVRAEDLARYLDPKQSILRRAQIGGPAPSRVAEQISRLRAWFRDDSQN
jgi:argininosuccinate lyase